MNQINQKEILYEGIKQTGIILSEYQAEQFLKYYELLIEWNQKINLTAITEFEQVVVKHFADSVSLLSAIEIPVHASMIDVGTGAGFPGIPLKIVRPDLNITLLDSLNKRVGFLNEIISSIHLEDTEGDIQAIHGRAEELSRSSLYRGQYDFAVSRAVSNISVISEYCIPFLKVNGIFAAYKSGGFAEEKLLYENGIKKLNAEIDFTKEFQITGANETADRTFVIIRKTDLTPDQYPRRSGIPEKRPLK